jgi:hypothetical protein
VPKAASGIFGRKQEVVLTPLVVTSESEMAATLREVERDLGDQEEWEKRLKALHCIIRLCMGDAGLFESFAVGLKAMHGLIASQVTDLRSSLAKEACAAVACVAEALGDGFVGLADLWAPAVLPLTCQAIAVMATAGEQCMRRMIAAGSKGFPAVLKRLVSAAGKRKGLDRANCLRYSNNMRCGVTCLPVI